MSLTSVCNLWIRVVMRLVALALQFEMDEWIVGVRNILRDILHELLKYFVTLNVCSLHFQWQMEDRKGICW